MREYYMIDNALVMSYYHAKYDGLSISTVKQPIVALGKPVGGEGTRITDTDHSCFQSIFISALHLHIL